MPLSEVYNMDCIEGMRRYPDKYFELAIVDPPYGIGLDMSLALENEKYNQKVIHNKNKDWNDAIPSPEYFTELYRVSKHQIIWGCNYYPGFIHATGRIVHDKQIGFEYIKKGLSFSHADLASCSLFNRIVMFRYQWSGFLQGGKPNSNNDGVDGRIHPTQKPISLYKYCLQFAKPGWKVLDTHLGSGSCRLAAYDLGFDFTGFEIDKEYFDAMEKRFNQYISQLKLAL